MVVAGDELSAEVCARALAAAGVGRLRLVRRTGPLPEIVLRALAESNPDVRVETVEWPVGAAWLAALRDAAVVVRVGFDDDAMVRACVSLGIPAVVLRNDGAGVDVLSMRRHGPCPHQNLDLPEQRASVPSTNGPTAVLAAQVASAEALVIIAGATTGEARARHVRVGLDAGPTHATDIPWRPECRACGGATDPEPRSEFPTSSKMSFS